jgi:hypothetical protein
MANPDFNPNFPDAKPFPGAEPPPMGHNRPPLEDRILFDFDEALRSKGLDAKAQEIIEAAGRAPVVDSEQAAGAVGDLVAMAGETAKAIEAEREVLNRPLLNAQRAMKGRADALTNPMRIAVIPLREALDAFIAEHAPVHGEMGARVGAREVWDFKIADYGKLPLSVRKHPDVLAAMDKVVRGLVRLGERKIAGVQIFPQTKSTVR